MNLTPALGDDYSDSFRLRTSGSVFLLEVNTVQWPHPHEPAPNWRRVRTWPSEPGEAQIKAAQADALANPKFLRVCRFCSRLLPEGWMHDQTTCCSCAETQFGIIH